jgi:hypothetical protein
MTQGTDKQTKKHTEMTQGTDYHLSVW